MWCVVAIFPNILLFTIFIITCFNKEKRQFRYTWAFVPQPFESDEQQDQTLQPNRSYTEPKRPTKMAADPRNPAYQTLKDIAVDELPLDSPINKKRLADPHAPPYQTLNAINELPFDNNKVAKVADPFNPNYETMAEVRSFAMDENARLQKPVNQQKHELAGNWQFQNAMNQNQKAIQFPPKKRIR